MSEASMRCCGGHSASPCIPGGDELANSYMPLKNVWVDIAAKHIDELVNLCALLVAYETEPLKGPLWSARMDARKR